jgi:flagellar hook-associated protein 1 FlgK
MVTQLENLRASVSGVSIDEETTSMLQFQRAYQASARVVTTIDELLQTTLGMFPA